MKILYNIGFSCKFILNDGTVIETPTEWSNLHYGKPVGFNSDGINTTIYDSFDDAMEVYLPGCYKDSTIFGNRKYIRANEGWHTHSIKEKDFEQLIITTCVYKVDPSFYTFSRLMDKLTVNEFIDFCKDNGLGVVVND